MYLGGFSTRCSLCNYMYDGRLPHACKLHECRCENFRSSKCKEIWMRDTDSVTTESEFSRTYRVDWYCSNIASCMLQGLLVDAVSNVALTNDTVLRDVQRRGRYLCRGTVCLRTAPLKHTIKITRTPDDIQTGVSWILGFVRVKLIFKIWQYRIYKQCIVQNIRQSILVNV